MGAVLSKFCKCCCCRHEKICINNNRREVEIIYQQISQPTISILEVSI
jgi:hypothetical protein